MFQTLTLTIPTSVRKLHSPHPSSRSALSFPTRSVNLNCRATVQNHRGTSAVSDSGNAPPATLYEVLMVNRDASTTEIKAAYRTLAKLHHPDASDGRSDGQDFIQIHQAYETLSDPATSCLSGASCCNETRM